MSKGGKRPAWFVAAAFAPLLASAPVFLPPVFETQAGSVQAGAVSRHEAFVKQPDGLAFWQAAASAADAEAQIESLLEHLSERAAEQDTIDAINDPETLKLKDSLSRMLEANRQLCPQKDKGTRTS